MKKIRCLLPLLLLALFTGCTLMIDEPETATTPQETENGDGITSPRRIVSDMGEVRYQIGPETRMIDKDYLPYLLTYKTDTLDRVTEIYFNKSIPLELLPQRGEFLATDQTDAIPNGLAHQVNLVRTTDNGYTVEVSPASYDDVYKTLDIVTDFDIVRVPVEQSNAYGFWKVAGDEPEYEYKLRGTYLNPLARYAPLRADDPIDKRWSIADLGFKLSKGHYTKLFSKYMLGDSAWDWEPSSGKASYNFHLDGDFDAYAGLEIFWHFHSDIRKDDGYADVATSIEYELKAGFGVWKKDKFIEDTITAEHLKTLLLRKSVKLRAKAKDGKIYSSDYTLEDTGKYVNLKRVQTEKISLGKCPKCGGDVYESDKNFFSSLKLTYFPLILIEYLTFSRLPPTCFFIL